MNKTTDNHIIVRDLGFSLLDEGKNLKIKAGGYSMYPSIKPGTTIIIEPLVADNDPVPGEIIVWKRESGFVVHRLVRTGRQGNDVIYFTRGDSCKYEDRPVTRDQIAGKVVRIEDSKRRIKEGRMLIIKPFHFINWISVKVLLIKNLVLNTKDTKVFTKVHKGLFK